MPDHTTSELAKAAHEVTEKAQLLVREEIALAKAEVTEKVTGIAIGAAGGIFVLAGLTRFSFALLIAISQANPWLGAI